MKKLPVYLARLFTAVTVVGCLCTSVSASGADKEMYLGHGAGDDFIVARVNGDPITWSALESKMRETATTNYGRKDITPALAERIKQESLDKLITEELAYQRAKQLGITVSRAEIEDHIAKMESQWGGAQHFQQYLNLRNWTAKDVWNEAERALMVKKALDKDIFSKIAIDEDELKKMYEENKESFNTQELVQVTDIIFFLDPKSPDSVRTVEQIRDKIVDELGGDPQKLVPDGTFVVQEKRKITAKQNPVLYREAVKLPEQGVSEPFIADETLHIVQLTGYRPRMEKTFEQVKPQLRSDLFAARKQDMLKKWIAGLRDGAKIEIVGAETQ